MDAADRYSRLIQWLKIALPLAALAILSTLFFVAESLNPEAAIPYAEVDVERILREQGVTRPSFGGVTAGGIAIAVTADSVRPSPGAPQTMDGTALSATLDLPSGGHIEITSPAGRVDGTTQTAALSGGARLESSTGYTVKTDRITASVADGSVISAGGVSATGPAGDVEAGRMELRRGEDGTYRLVFSEGVRLIYRPTP